MEMHIKDLKVQTAFLLTAPNRGKLNNKRAHIKEHPGSSYVIVDPNNVIVDGYINLLVFLEMGYVWIPVMRSPNETSRDSVFIQDSPYLESIRYGAPIHTSNTITKRSSSSVIPVQTLYSRQHGRCYICGRKMTFSHETDFPTVDHIIPLSLGGSNKESNLAACCARCNQLKGRLMLTEGLRNTIKRQRELEKTELFVDSKEFTRQMWQEGLLFITVLIEREGSRWGFVCIHQGGSFRGSFDGHTLGIERDAVGWMPRRMLSEFLSRIMEELNKVADTPPSVIVKTKRVTWASILKVDSGWEVHI